MTTQQTMSERLQYEVMENYIMTAELGHLAVDHKKHKEELRECFKELVAFITSEIGREREEIINILKVVEGEKWDDEVHCTCLAYAIDALEGKSDESKENLKRLQDKVNTQ